MILRTLSAIALTGATLTTAVPAAQADELIPGTAGARNVASLAGYAVWSQPDGGRYVLKVRSPAGEISTPSVRSFAAPPLVKVGSDAGVGAKRLVAVYPRCAGDSQVRGCDIHQLDLASGSERKAPGLATRAYSETAAAISGGNYAVVRRGGPKPGTYYVDPGRTVRRLTRALAYEVAYAGTRIGALERVGGGARLVVRRASGDGPALVKTGLAGFVSSLNATRYRMEFAEVGETGTQLFATNRTGSGEADTPIVLRPGSRVLSGADSVGLRTNAGHIGWATTPQGLVRLDPPVTF